MCGFRLHDKLVGFHRWHPFLTVALVVKVTQQGSRIHLMLDAGPSSLMLPQHYHSIVLTCCVIWDARAGRWSLWALCVQSSETKAMLMNSIWYSYFWPDNDMMSRNGPSVRDVLFYHDLTCGFHPQVVGRCIVFLNPLTAGAAYIRVFIFY